MISISVSSQMLFGAEYSSGQPWDFDLMKESFRKELTLFDRQGRAITMLYFVSYIDHEKKYHVDARSKEIYGRIFSTHFG